MTDKPVAVDMHWTHAAMQKAQGMIEKMPPHMREGLTAYFWNGRETGGFMRRVLEGDFDLAERSADPTNRGRARSYYDLLIQFAPGKSFGSAGEVDAWIKSGGLCARQPTTDEARSL